MSERPIKTRPWLVARARKFAEADRRLATNFDRLGRALDHWLRTVGGTAKDALSN